MNEFPVQSQKVDARAHASEILEFDKIREQVAGYARSEEGQAFLKGAEPEWAEEGYLRLKERIRDWVRLESSGAAIPSALLPPIVAFLPSLPKEGVVLDLEELYACGCWARSALEMRQFLSNQKDYPSLLALAVEIPDGGSIREGVFSILTRDGELKDLPALRDIRRAIGRLRSEIDSLTARYLSDESMRSLLQSEVPTQRNGRTVIAVKANYRGRIRGIVHESSATGQTVYIEPDDVLEKNNDLVKAEARLREEILKILREATERLRPEATALESIVKSMIELDADLSRARYTGRNRYEFADDSDSRLELIASRHPLLGSKAVPIDLSLPEGVRVLIVSGPNTGGKTVSLKTAGLLALMNQFGLGIPAAPHSSLPFFSGVFADIGDEQSLSQSLSTFSGHMRNVSAIVEEAGPRSLVLLDELGSGTDPEEGSAIGMALLDRFLGSGALTLVTSHHGILKNYGYTRDACLNASVDFDGQTLSPTYRIVMGVPGESHALDIARRNGLADTVVEKARTYLAEERADVSALIKGLKSKHLRAEELERDRERKMKETLEERRKTDLKELRLKQKELELKRTGAADLKRLFEESRRGLENLVRELKEGEITREKTLKVKDFIASFEERVRQEGERLDSFDREARALERSQSGEIARDTGLRIEAGTEVLVGQARRRGKVLREGKKGSWVVETDALRMTVLESELIPVKPKEGEKQKIEIALSGLSSSSAVYQLDLRGMRREEALKAVERQIDAASLSNLHEFGIIHGTGEGILKDGVREYLAACPAVADFAFARPEDGGFGKTVVKLR